LFFFGSIISQVEPPIHYLALRFNIKKKKRRSHRVVLHRGARFRVEEDEEGDDDACFMGCVIIFHYESEGIFYETFDTLERPWRGAEEEEKSFVLVLG
jgi:hypothetical protein